MSFLLDTDICSAYLKGDRRVFGRFQQHAGQLHASVVTAAGLFTWALRAKAPASRMAGITALFSDVPRIGFDEGVARKFGEVRARQLDKGTPTPVLDLQIAATALAHDLTLVTHNTSDYAGIPDLRLDDWLIS